MAQGSRKTLRAPGIRYVNGIYRDASQDPTGAVGSSMLPAGRTPVRLPAPAL